MQKRVLLAVMVLCALVLVGVRVGLVFEAQRHDALAPFVGEERVVEGKIVNDPEARETSLHVHIEVSRVDNISAHGKLLAIIPRETALAYGDSVIVRGKLVEPEEFVTDTGRIFDYPGYLRVRGISVLMRYGEVEERVQSGATFFGTLYSLKHAFEDSLERVLPEPQAALFEGILLGERRALPEALTAAFIVASLIHIVVLSGYNISIIGEAVMRGLRFLPRFARLLCGGALMILFVALTGASSTALRALIMALIAILARYLRRPAAALRALGVAALLMIAWNPLIALYDSGFILSIVATFGLITLAPFVEARLTALSRYPQLRAIASSTIAVQIFILPALLYFTGVLSFVALPANLLVLPFVSLVMFVGFVAGLLGMVHGALAFIPAFVADLLLRYMIEVAEISAALPFASVVIPPFPAWIAFVLYIPLTLAALRIYSRTQTN